ncbi:MAG: hypothetical protein H0Z19_00360 [Archaeoglobus sp.]|uniref:hypothetical protein n=1 Tax=Archaeoglobus sp. TaxID=1872626 RepID=UPI001DD9A066|nr:hypothetical protein [Archaeoglobus sp.]MBO8178928.1 hypothetical protein [Archaeoglobus sp.]
MPLLTGGEYKCEEIPKGAELTDPISLGTYNRPSPWGEVALVKELGDFYCVVISLMYFEETSLLKIQE